MTFSHFNRRLHVYLSLGLLPWVLMYGISSYFFAHPDVGRGWYGDRMQWSPIAVAADQLPADIAFPERGAPPEIMRPFVRRVLETVGWSELRDSASYGGYHTSPKQISIFVYRFLEQRQVKVDIETRRLVTEQKHFRWDHFFTGMHSRGGFHNDGVWNFVWAIVVDISSIGFLLWVATGLYMWWTLGARTAKAWGWVALIGGVASFTLFLMKL